MVETSEIGASRGKILGFLAICLGFVAVAVLVPERDDGNGWRWPTIILFGLGAALFLFALVRPQRLMLDAEGFTLVGGLRGAPRRVAWRDVEGFHVYRLPRGGRMIGYNHALHARRDTYLGDLNRRFGADAVLPKTLAGSPEAIVARLNAYREEALRR